MIRLFQIIGKMKIYSALMCILLLTTYTSSVSNQSGSSNSGLIVKTPLKEKPILNKEDSLKQEIINYQLKVEYLKDSILKQQIILDDKN